MREMRGEVGKKTPEKEMDNPSFLWRHMAYFLDTLYSYQLAVYDKLKDTYNYTTK